MLSRGVWSHLALVNPMLDLPTFAVVVPEVLDGLGGYEEDDDPRGTVAMTRLIEQHRLTINHLSGTAAISIDPTDNVPFLPS
ncbi:hypothetical protein CGMCC3_g16773 [Colletotrichum fructicola]|nr:uncharacterized protein CGMCC3_g16773 [Colletotrichum fructicola]KAE9567059.1 hypothetical protein CGMCC3_g16773 [Colletotrichum fructicola]